MILIFRELTPSQIYENNVITEFRGDIERVFGKCSRLFNWWGKNGRGYQGDEAHFNQGMQQMKLYFNFQLLQHVLLFGI